MIIGILFTLHLIQFGLLYEEVSMHYGRLDLFDVCIIILVSPFYFVSKLIKWISNGSR